MKRYIVGLGLPISLTMQVSSWVVTIQLLSVHWVRMPWLMRQWKR